MSLRTLAFQGFCRALIKRRPRTQKKAVAHFRRVARPSTPTLLPPGVRKGAATLGGVECALLEVEQSQRALLYIHGGGFVAGMPETYFNFCSRLGQALSARVILPRYRLAPEYPFPAGPEDVLAVYKALLDEGTAPESIIVAGDSAGGSLALSLLHNARAAGLPQPAACLAISPSTDVSLSGGSHSRNDRRDPMLTQALIEHFNAAYVPTESERTQPLCSPSLGDCQGLAPMVITVSRDECLYDHSIQMAAAARKAGVPVDLLERPGLFHIWPVMVPYLPEAERDLGWIITALKNRLCPM